MYCQNCGANCKENAKFCSKCGTSLLDSSPSKNEKNSSTSKIQASPVSGSSPSGAIGGIIATDEPDTSENIKNKQKNGIQNAAAAKSKKPAFSKTCTCVRCGKEFFAKKNTPYCTACQNRMKKEKESVSGYIEYLKSNKLKLTGLDDIAFQNELISHRDAILNKYKENAITQKELEKASENYRYLSRAEAIRIYLRGLDISYSPMFSSALSNHFIMPGDEEGTIVDFDDVFAVGISWKKKPSEPLDSFTKSDCLCCLLLSSDCYMPAVRVYKDFPWERRHSNRDINFKLMQQVFSSLCKNLTYPVQDLRSLQDIVSSEGVMRGKMDWKLAMDQISDAVDCLSWGYCSIYECGSLEEVPEISRYVLEKHGYISTKRLSRILFNDNQEKYNFWMNINESLKKIDSNEKRLAFPNDPVSFI